MSKQLKVLVSDSSVLIEFSKRELLEEMFGLDFQFAVPDLLFHEELIDLGVYNRQDLLCFGLRVESLDAEGVEKAIRFQSDRPALSLVDSFALALAAHHGWPLLTEDRTMRGVADSQCIRHLGTMWILERMLDAAILSVSELMAVYEVMRNDPRCPVPKTELNTRIQDLGN